MFFCFRNLRSGSQFLEIQNVTNDHRQIQVASARPSGKPRHLPNTSSTFKVPETLCCFVVMVLHDCSAVSWDVYYVLYHVSCCHLMRRRRNDVSSSWWQDGSDALLRLLTFRGLPDEDQQLRAQVWKVPLDQRAPVVWETAPDRT